MNKAKKITNFIVLGIIISIISLCSCVSAFGIANANMGVAVESYDIFEMKVSDISDLYYDNDSFEVLKNPIVDEKNTISCGVLAKEVLKYAQFQFNLENKGNINVKVDSIDVTGYEDYSDYIDVIVEGINVGDIIVAESITPVKVKIVYRNPSFDETGVQKNIELSNLKINVEFKKE